MNISFIFAITNFTALLTFVNRHYPPNKNVTGENIWDIVKYLTEEKGIECHIVHIDRDYTGGGYQRKPLGTVHKVSTIYAGDNRILRYIAGMWDGYHLIRKAKKINKGKIVVLTSPPLLPMWASIMLKKSNWVLWSMDLFPEGFGAINELKKNGFFYNLFLKNTYKNSPSKIIALGPNQKEYIEASYGKKIDGTILPCGVFYNQDINNIKQTNPEWKTDNEKIYFGYCGNCSTPHNPEFVLAAIDGIDPTKHRLMIAVYGLYSNKIKEYALGKDGVILIDNIPRHELGFIDVHLVSLLPSWTHIAVPSKAISCICSGATMIFCGSALSDNWVLLNDASWIIDDNEDMNKELHLLMNKISKNDIVDKRSKALQISKNLDNLVKTAYSTISTWANH